MLSTHRPLARSSALLALVACLAVIVSMAGANAGSAVGAAPTSASAPTWGISHVANGSFEARGAGWRSNRTLRFARGGPTGKLRAALSTRGSRRARLWDVGTTASGADAMTKWRATVWVRTTRANANGRLQVVQRAGESEVVHARKFRLRNRKWQRVKLELLVTKAAADLDVVLQTGRLWRKVMLVDNLKLQTVKTSSPDAEAEPDPPTSGHRLTNGCTASKRGVPSCGTYFGGITGSNGDPSSIEKAAGTKYGVRRTYWGPTGVSGAVTTVKQDHANGRVPWLSFKLPHSWSEMANGKGDAWVKNLVDRLDATDRPVWLAFHHEPENDSGSIANWTRMQEHLGPIVRQRADNVGFSVIVMGWHQWYGAEHLRIENMWPDTKVDVSGFDVYNFQGMPDGNGGVRTKWVDFENKYFKVISAWAKKNNTVWGLAETGLSNYSAERDKTWIRDTYQLMKQYDGVAFSYFNTWLNSKADWTLAMPSKMTDFQAALKKSPHMQ